MFLLTFNMSIYAFILATSHQAPSHQYGISGLVNVLPQWLCAIIVPCLLNLGQSSVHAAHIHSSNAQFGKNGSLREACTCIALAS